jgi:uncharacterized damage-inducible protein DinB
MKLNRGLLTGGRAMAIQELFEHIENSRKLVLEAAEKLDRESFLSRQKGMSSIRDLLVHLMDSEDYWVGSVIRGEKREKFLPDKYEDVAALKAHWDGIHERTKKLLSDVSEGRVSEKTSVQWEGKTTLDVGTVLLHLFTHELYHCGQICLLMREQGHEPPYMDLL